MYMKLKSLSELKNLLPETVRVPGASTDDRHDGKGKPVRITLDTKGRKGKSVTIVSGLQHNPETMRDIARILKEHCGAGGTVKHCNIELQGDQRTRAAVKLSGMNYVVPQPMGGKKM